jgi:hypothetical protein
VVQSRVFAPYIVYKYVPHTNALSFRVTARRVALAAARLLGPALVTGSLPIHRTLPGTRTARDRR